MRVRNMAGLTLTAALLSVVPIQQTSAATIPAASITAPGIDAHSGMLDFAVFGFQFAPTTSIAVSQLGVFDFQGDGIINTHSVGLWSDNGVLLASAVISAGTSATLFDGFRYTGIVPIILSAGVKYRIAADYAFGEAEDHMDADILPLDTHVFSSDISYLSDAGTGAAGYGLTFPDNLGGTTGNKPSGALGPNFQFETVPEPGTLALLGLSLAGVVALGRRR